MVSRNKRDWHRYTIENFNDALEDAHSLLIRAADEWAKGDPEQPPTRKVLLQLLEQFIQHELLSRPYGARRE